MHPWIEVDIWGIDKGKRKLYIEEPELDREEVINELLEEIDDAICEIKTETDDAIYQLNRLAEEAESELDNISD